MASGQHKLDSADNFSFENFITLDSSEETAFHSESAAEYPARAVRTRKSVPLPDEHTKPTAPERHERGRRPRQLSKRKVRPSRAPGEGQRPAGSKPIGSEPPRPTAHPRESGQPPTAREPRGPPAGLASFMGAGALRT